jgi:Cu/Ag efflux protein CusF
MKKVFMWASAFVLVLSLAVAGAQEKKAEGTAERPKVVKERAIKMTATVEAIDLDKRHVTLKGPTGEKKTITVGPEARNLPQVKVGDLVTVTYYESMAVEVVKPGSGSGAGQASTIVRAKPGEMPGGTAIRTATVMATVTAIDKKENTLTLKGPQGNTVIAPVEDPANLDKVKVGDELMITVTEALAISVEHAKQK